MIPTYPWCHGIKGKPHVLTQMRVERISDGAVPVYRCPECWRSAPMYQLERLDDLACRDEAVVIVSRETVEWTRNWSKPIRVRFVDTDDPRIVEMQAQVADSETVAS